MEKLPLTLGLFVREEGLAPLFARLKELAGSSRLDLSDESGWELLADQCEENGEAEGVVRLALVTAWRVGLQKLHGLLEWDREVMRSVGRLKCASSSQSVLRTLDQVRTAIGTSEFVGKNDNRMANLLHRAALSRLDRLRALHDRLKARRMMREK